MAKFDEIKNLVMGLEGDFDKFYNKGNQAAGTRVRKGMQDLKNLAQAILQAPVVLVAAFEEKARRFLLHMGEKFLLFFVCLADFDIGHSRG